MIRLYKIGLFLLVGLIYSCTKDIVVPNIKDETIKVNAPANNLVTSENTITFWWELLDGAEKYNLQVVRPNFTAVAKLLLDTNITKDKFTLAMQPGSYQWRIKAINGAGETEFQVYTLKIDSTNLLTSQLVIPISPLTGYSTREKNTTFLWNALSGATSYSVEVSLNNSVINYTTTSSTSYAYTFTLTSAANYTCSWRVKAINASSISNYNNPQTFTIDLLPPSVSTPSTPLNSTFVKDTVSLTWKKTGGTDTEFDSLFIYTDAGFLNLARTTTISTSSIKINQIDTGNPLTAGTTTASAIPYWWRLKSVDEKGNTSGFSNALSFQLYQ